MFMSPAKLPFRTYDEVYMLSQYHWGMGKLTMDIPRTRGGKVERAITGPSGAVARIRSPQLYYYY